MCLPMIYSINRTNMSNCSWFLLVSEDDVGQTALLQAAAEGRVDVVRLLLQKKAKVDAHDDVVSVGCILWILYRSKTPSSIKFQQD